MCGKVFAFVKRKLSGAQRRKSAASGERTARPVPASQHIMTRSATTLRLTDPGDGGLLGLDVYYNVVFSMAEILGTFEQAVLLAIIRLADDAYGRAISKEVGTRLGREVAPGAVQATLERLENKRLISSQLGSGTPIRAGRPRRFYRVAPSGISALNEARTAVEQLWRGLRWPLKGHA